MGCASAQPETAAEYSAAMSGTYAMKGSITSDFCNANSGSVALRLKIAVDYAQDTIEIAMINESAALAHDPATNEQEKQLVSLVAAARMLAKSVEDVTTTGWAFESVRSGDASELCSGCETVRVQKSGVAQYKGEGDRFEPYEKLTYTETLQVDVDYADTITTAVGWTCNRTMIYTGTKVE